MAMLSLHKEVQDVRTSLATPDELRSVNKYETPILSYSSLTNYNRCPTLGVILKSIGKTLGSSHPDKALEAGSVCHEVYSAIRLYQLIQQDLPAHAWHHARRIFGDARADTLWRELDNADPRVALYNFAMHVLYSSGYTDDAYDKKRTFVNIEDSLNDYLNYYNYDRWPVFILDHDDVTSFVGIEIPVVMRVSFEFRNGDVWSVYIDGVIDGIHYDAKNINRIVVNENKTSSVIDSTWYQQFALDHQLTIYALMTTLVMHRSIEDVHLYGMPIPLGRRQQTGMEPYRRTAQQHYANMFQWILTALETHHTYKASPLDAPRFTHSCRRYFRPCSLLPICDATREVQEEELGMLQDAEDEHVQRLIDAYISMHDTFSDERMKG